MFAVEVPCAIRYTVCLSEALFQSREAMWFPGLKMGQAFDARSEVMPESVPNYCDFNTRETEVSSTAIFLWGKAGQLSF